MDASSRGFGRSISRMQYFYTCKKKFFFKYYTDHIRLQFPALYSDVLLLRQLTGFSMRLGNKTHQLISLYLTELWNSTRSGTPAWGFALDAYKRTCKDRISSIMTNEFTQARTRSYTTYDSHLSFGLKEFCYGNDIPLSLDEAIQRVFANLDALCSSSLHEQIQQQFCSSRLVYIDPVEKNFTSMQFRIQDHPLLQHVVLWAIPDCGIVTNEGAYYIYDWKTGRETIKKDISSQLQVYAYKLLVKTHTALEDVAIYAYEVYLPSLYTCGGKIQSHHIDAIKNRIIDDIQIIRNFLVDGDIRRNMPLPIQNFSRTSDCSVCRFCSFRRVCAALKKLEGDTTPNPILDRYVV